MKKLRVLILQGGTSSEHEISISSGNMVAQGLLEEKYDTTSVTITKEGTWLLPEERSHAIEHDSKAGSVVVTYQSGEALDEVRSRGFDIVFIALHGTFGEDGAVQGLMELAGIPYTGSGMLASALAMDKVRAAEILQFHGLMVPKYITFTHAEWLSQPAVIASQTASSFGFPVVIKPRDSGSSVGISIVDSLDHLGEAVESAFLERPRVIAQEFIKGMEVTCPVLDNGSDEVTPLIPIEIVPSAHGFYNYQAKYVVGGSNHIIPPRLPAEMLDTIQKIAARAHKALGCSGMSRTDMIIRNEEIFVLEVNTIPGLTPTSLLPESASIMGIGFPELLDRIIHAGIERSRRGSATLVSLVPRSI